MLALVLTLDVHPEHRDTFLSAATQNRTACLHDEPGCLHFDTAEDSTNPNRSYFYEEVLGCNNIGEPDLLMAARR